MDVWDQDPPENLGKPRTAPTMIVFVGTFRHHVPVRSLSILSFDTQGNILCRTSSNVRSAQYIEKGDTAALEMTEIFREDGPILKHRFTVNCELTPPKAIGFQSHTPETQSY